MRFYALGAQNHGFTILQRGAPNLQKVRDNLSKIVGDHVPEVLGNKLVIKKMILFKVWEALFKVIQVWSNMEEKTLVLRLSQGGFLRVLIFKYFTPVVWKTFSMCFLMFGKVWLVIRELATTVLSSQDLKGENELIFDQHGSKGGNESGSDVH